MNVDEIRVYSVLLLSHVGPGGSWDLIWSEAWDVNQSVTTVHAADGETETSETDSLGVLKCFIYNLKVWTEDTVRGAEDCMYGCLVTEINDISHAVSSSSSCLSSPFPDLSIITVGLYFTFLHTPEQCVVQWCTAIFWLSKERTAMSRQDKH